MLKSKRTPQIIIAAFVMIMTLWLSGIVGLVTPIHSVQAQTSEEKISVLKEQITALQAQIAALQNQLKELSPQAEVEKEVPPETSTSCYFKTNLKYGDRGLEVEKFQMILKSDPTIYPEGLITGYFGPLTRAAVIRFQEKYAADILAPWGLTKGTGFVGTTTRAKLCRLPLPKETVKTPPCDSFGDVTLDGYVTKADSGLVLNYVVDKQTLTQEQLRRADVNNDGSITSTDAMFILQYFEGKIATFEICKAPKPPCNSYGDVDKDSYITKTDSNLVLNYVVGTQTLTLEQKTRADVDGDGDVDSVDSMFILQYTEGTKDSLPICSAKTITIISPNGGEEWVIGNIYTIKWNAPGYSSTTKIQIGLRDTRFDPNLGIGEATIVNTTNTASYSWTIPKQLDVMTLGVGNVYKIVIYIGGGGPGKLDISDAPFSIIAAEMPSLITSLASDTPVSSNITPGSLNVPFLKFILQVNNVENFYLKSVEVQRVRGSNNDFGLIKLFDETGALISTTALSSYGVGTRPAGTAVFAIYPSIKIPKGGAKSFIVKADISSSANVGDVVSFKVHLIVAVPEVSADYSIAGSAEGSPMTIVEPPIIGTAYGPEYNIAPPSTEERIDIPAAEVTLESELQTLLELINDHRASYGFRTLLASPALTAAAQWMSEDMAANYNFDHTDSLGRGPYERMSDFGYNYDTWKGENLAMTWSTPEGCFETWRDSPGHNANQLNENYRVIGLGRAYTDDAFPTPYWVADFGGYNDTGLEPGDADCSGNVDAVDALFTMQYVVGLRPGVYRCPLPGENPKPINLTSADVYRYGEVDGIDALFILQYVVGIRDSLETFSLVAPFTDTDSDMLTDQEEAQYSCLDPLVYDSESDPDNDGLNNMTERVLGTDPCGDDA